MKLYCNVINNEVMNSPHVLPPSLEGLPDDVLLSRGWYVVERVVPDTFSDRTEVMAIPTCEVFATYVRATFVKRNKTANELTEQDTAKWITVRSYRNELLARSDYITTIDRWASLSTEKKAEWTNYRQALRDIPQDNVDPWTITTPVAPDYVPPSMPGRPV